MHRIPPCRRAARPSVETLEPIQLMTITDMTTLAQVAGYKPPTPPTIWLDFDGYTPPAKSSNAAVLPFQQGASDRDQQIQDILFKTAEIFAPFNVKVERTLKPAEIQPHDKEVFVGQIVKAMGPFGVTPGASSDYPRAGSNQGPNTHTGDIAFVDPFDINGVKKWTDAQIAQGIAHETGHTFGLAHIRTDGKADPAALVPNKNKFEVMSYNSPTTRFSNTTYPITDFNYDPSKGVDVATPGLYPAWAGQTITQQNSYTYLKTLLGPRPKDDGYDETDPSWVDPSAADYPILPMFYATTQAKVDRNGDYDVYWYQNSPNGLVVALSPTAKSALIPELTVYDQNGAVVDFFDGASVASHSTLLLLPANAGSYFSVVVGSEDSRSTGGYQLTVNDHLFLAIPQPKPAAGSSFAAPSSAVAMIALAPASGEGLFQDDRPSAPRQARHSLL